jgi:hypothetical protein
VRDVAWSISRTVRARYEFIEPVPGHSA